ncbi:hypothetical protein EFE32_07210 [Lactococcus lactis subsp. lactis]|nr:hypothetical protein [Lactococcus lactis subsp. lactis]
MYVSSKSNRKEALLLMDVAMLIIATCDLLISLLTFIVLLIEKIAKNKNRLNFWGAHQLTVLRLITTTNF